MQSASTSRKRRCDQNGGSGDAGAKRGQKLTLEHLDKTALIERLNGYGSYRRPCFFAISFEGDYGFVYALDELPESVSFCIDGFCGGTQPTAQQAPALKSKKPIPFSEYESCFEQLQSHFAAGDCYLANLTASTKIELDGSLSDLYASAKADFKLLLDERIVCFSPERFIRIDDRTIMTQPMKGTCDIQKIQELLESQKEFAEHTMTVDLLRNDLAIVAERVRLENFREVVMIEAGNKRLAQTISTVSGELSASWRESLGGLLLSLLPAGSVSGTPKRKSVELLKKIESHKRGFFCGIFGYFDGESLDSAVAIRFIERNGDGLVFKSGGGITCDSDALAEYEELMEKVYVPTV